MSVLEIQRGLYEDAALHVPEQLIMIKEHLKEFYEVTLVNSGKNAFKAMGKYKFDLILLDYLMPDMDGPDTLESIREYPEFRSIPVIFLTKKNNKKQAKQETEKVSNRKTY